MKTKYRKEGKEKPSASGLRENSKLTSHYLITSNKIRALQVHILFVQSFQSHKQGATESKKYDHKHHTEATHISINHLGQCSGIQTSSAVERRKRLAYRFNLNYCYRAVLFWCDAYQYEIERVCNVGVCTGWDHSNDSLSSTSLHCCLLHCTKYP